VCDELNADTQVFPLAVKLLDMTLSRVSVNINQLQLLGATCMHIASKLRSANIVSTKQCEYYADHSFNTRAINVRFYTLTFLRHIFGNFRNYYLILSSIFKNSRTSSLKIRGLAEFRQFPFSNSLSKDFY
jgi:Cyclin, N-terminal domain